MNDPYDKIGVEPEVGNSLLYAWFLFAGLVIFAMGFLFGVYVA